MVMKVEENRITGQLGIAMAVRCIEKRAGCEEFGWCMVHIRGACIVLQRGATFRNFQTLFHQKHTLEQSKSDMNREPIAAQSLNFRTNPALFLVPAESVFKVAVPCSSSYFTTPHLTSPHHHQNVRPNHPQSPLSPRRLTTTRQRKRRQRRATRSIPARLNTPQLRILSLLLPLRPVRRRHSRNRHRRRHLASQRRKHRLPHRRLCARLCLWAQHTAPAHHKPR